MDQHLLALSYAQHVRVVKSHVNTVLLQRQDIMRWFLEKFSKSIFAFLICCSFQCYSKIGKKFEYILSKSKSFEVCIQWITSGNFRETFSQTWWIARVMWPQHEPAFTHSSKRTGMNMAWSYFIPVWLRQNAINGHRLAQWQEKLKKRYSLNN